MKEKCFYRSGEYAETGNDVRNEMSNQAFRDTLEVDFLKGSSFELREPGLNRDDFDCRYKAIHVGYSNGEVDELDFNKDALLLRDIEIYLTRATHYYWVALKLKEKEEFLFHGIDPITILSELYILWFKREVDGNGYDPSRGKFKERVFFSTYVGSIKVGLIAAAVRQLRRNAYKQTRAEKAAFDDFDGDGMTLEEEAEKSKFYRDVLRCLQNMADKSETEKRYFVYRLLGYSVRESMELLGLHDYEEEKLHNLFSRMKAKVAESLKELGYPDDIFLAKIRVAKTSTVRSVEWNE